MAMEHTTSRPGDLTQMSVEDLQQQVKHAYTHYCQTGASDGRFAYELFRRAIENQHEQSWQAIMEIYTPVVAAWIEQSERGRWLLKQGRESIPILVNASFLKFFMGLRSATKLQQFSSLAALLSYLKRCAHSAVYDTYNLQITRWEHEQLEDISCEDPALTVETAHVARKLWSLVLGELRSKQERIVLISIYQWDMKPREISEAYQDLFPTTKDVHRVKQNMLARLRHNQQLHFALHGMLAS